LKRNLCRFGIDGLSKVQCFLLVVKQLRATANGDRIHAVVCPRANRRCNVPVARGGFEGRGAGHVTRLSLLRRGGSHIPQMTCIRGLSRELPRATGGCRCRFVW